MAYQNEQFRKRPYDFGLVSGPAAIDICNNYFFVLEEDSFRFLPFPLLPPFMAVILYICICIYYFLFFIGSLSTTSGGSCDEEDDYFGSKKKRQQKRGILPKHATSVMRSWLFQHLIVRTICILQNYMLIYAYKIYERFSVNNMLFQCFSIRTPQKTKKK